jgi:hypothetical protein
MLQRVIFISYEPSHASPKARHVVPDRVAKSHCCPGFCVKVGDVLQRYWIAKLSSAIVSLGPAHAGNVDVCLELVLQLTDGAVTCRALIVDYFGANTAGHTSATLVLLRVAAVSDASAPLDPHSWLRFVYEDHIDPIRHHRQFSYLWHSTKGRLSLSLHDKWVSEVVLAAAGPNRRKPFI